MIIATFLIPLYYTKFSHSAITSKKSGLHNIISQKMDFFSGLKAFLRAFIKKSPKFEEWSCAFPEICRNPRFFRDDAQKAAELRPFDLAADEMQRGFDVFFAHVEDGGQA